MPPGAADALPPTRRRNRGCIVVLAVAAVLLIVAGVLGTLALAAPDLDPAPGGVDHGESEIAIAASLGTSLGTQLAVSPHGVITLSEHDLTVLIRENNPSPNRFRDPNARIRGGQVVIDAHTPVGPFTVDAVAHMALARAIGADQLPEVTATFTAVQVGSLGLPDFAARALQDRVQQAFDLQDVLASNEYLRAARQALDCVLVASDGVRLGFHRPGTAGAPAACG